MTDTQILQSLIMECLEASKDIPRNYEWLSLQVRLAGESDKHLRAALDDLESRGLVSSGLDALGVRRWMLTNTGLQQAEKI